VKRLAIILLSFPAILFAIAWLLSITAPTLVDYESRGHRDYAALGAGGLYLARYTNNAYQGAPTELRRWKPDELAAHERTFRDYAWHFGGFGVRRGGRALTNTGDFGYAVYRIPLWAPTLAFALPPLLLTLIALGRRRRTARRRSKGLCPACGYDLRASTTHCPECGSATPA
jgi:hypothetical protein